jgi:hypothetical protein
MNSIERNLANWKASLLPCIPVAGLLARSPVAYKWKAPFRSWMLREAVSWRLHDLMTQSYALHTQGHVLGARILLRSGFETLAVLIYLNQSTNRVLDGTQTFQCFGEKTSRLLVGTRKNTTRKSATNVLTLLDSSEKRHPGLREIYDNLSESAHPNYEGLCLGYSQVDRSEYQMNFSNRWMELHGDQQLGAI